MVPHCSNGLERTGETSPDGIASIVLPVKQEEEETGTVTSKADQVDTGDNKLENSQKPGKDVKEDEEEEEEMADFSAEWNDRSSFW